MQITVKEDNQMYDICIEIVCPKIDEQVNRILAGLHAFGGKLSGIHEGKTYLLSYEDVFYIESVDGKTFLYTNERVLETQFKLYEMEERLKGTEFMRISKQMIVNFDKIAVIEPELNMRLRLILANGEAVIVSRQYTPHIKQRLGL